MNHRAAVGLLLCSLAGRLEGAPGRVAEAAIAQAFDAVAPP